MNQKTSFSPLLFLSSLGAGGIAVSFFAFINYSLPHGKGLIDFAQTHALSVGFYGAVYGLLEILMILFVILHFTLTAILFKRFIPWMKSSEFKEFIRNPLTNAGFMAPLVSLTMSMNVMIGSVRYFIPGFYNNLQSMMLPGLIAWAVLWLLVMYWEIRLLKNSFIAGFDINKIHFGWLLHPMALGMVTVTGTGIAALSADKGIADIAFFMSLISGSMGLFLLAVKAISLFKRHFAGEGLPEKQFLPSLLVVIPNVTLYAISLFRFGHYLEHHQSVHLGAFFTVIMTLALAFEVWYFMFGLSLLSDYIKKDFFREFHISQWGFICPLVALSVLSSFVYALFWQSPIFFALITTNILATSALFFYLLKRQALCAQARTNPAKATATVCA